MAKSPNKVLPIAYPTAGVARGLPFAAQPAGTCRDALNARSFDELTKRVRGGQRCGLSKWYGDLVDSTDIQDINSVAYADDGTYASPDTGYIPGAPGGTPNAPAIVPYGQVFDPGAGGGSTNPWYLQSRVCSTGAKSGKYLEWGAAGITGGFITQGGVRYRFNYFDPVVATPGTLHTGYTPCTDCGGASPGGGCVSTPALCPASITLPTAGLDFGLIGAHSCTPALDLTLAKLFGYSIYTVAAPTCFAKGVVLADGGGNVSRVYWNNGGCRWEAHLTVQWIGLLSYVRATGSPNAPAGTYNGNPAWPVPHLTVV
jgi:hypothetical protein